jgi:hypothetical protein
VKISKIRFTIIVVLISLINISCTDSTSQISTPTNKIPVISDENGISPDPYPAPETPIFEIDISSSYPAPENEADQATNGVIPKEINSIPTPDLETGIVVGKLLTLADQEPFLTALFLANTIWSEDAKIPPIISFSEGINQQALQDKTGQFFFTNVSPGKYALIIKNPAGGKVIKDPKSNEVIVFEVWAGEITDLESIFIK